MSFFTSLSGMRNAETDLRVISHNIANAETAGFKKSSAAFADLVPTGGNTDPRLTPGIGATVSAITQNFGLGALEQTGRGLDVAINGDGFFATANPASGDLTFTRNGNLSIVASGALQDANGDLVQAFPVDPAGVTTSAVPGNVVVPTVNAAGSSLSSVSINPRGLVSAAYSDGTSEPVAQIALASFPATGGLRSIGQTKWQATASSGAPQYGDPGIGNYGQLMAGSLERSNVDLAEEMVSLLTAQRNFQANARAIDTATAISQTVINLQR
ncbi:MAG: flagellar hook basal-body protein [Erythrobacter sp.]|jgi:flagellar hook protein FlgE|nr:flagellar hook basal-body protein [Erythrobacter sp.]